MTAKFYRYILFTAAIILILIPQTAARADCAAPSGTEGLMDYFTADKTFKFCNGTDWVDMGSGGAPSLFGPPEARSVNTNYTDATDGIVTYGGAPKGGADTCYMWGYVDGTRIAMDGQRQGYGNFMGSSFPVAKGKEWHVDATSGCDPTNNQTLYFTPVGY